MMSGKGGGGSGDGASTKGDGEFEGVGGTQLLNSLLKKSAYKSSY